MKKTISTIAVLAYALLSNSFANEPEAAPIAEASPSPSINDFVGEWSINLDQTLEEAQKSPVAETKTEELPKLIESQIGTMKLRVSEKELVYIQGDQEVALPFSVTGAIDNKVTIASQKADAEENLTLALVDGEFLNLQSDTKDDLNFYIWQKAF